MKIIPIHKGKVENGRLELYDKVGFMGYLTTLMGEVEVIVRRPEKPRSDGENKYFHAVICPMFAEKLYELGKIDSPDPLIAKEILKAMFLKEIIEINGKTIKYVTPTHLLSTVEFENFCKNCRQLGDTIGIYIPKPNEADFK